MIKSLKPEEVREIMALEEDVQKQQALQLQQRQQEAMAALTAGSTAVNGPFAGGIPGLPNIPGFNMGQITQPPFNCDSDDNINF
eukprot:CAMPEP_0201596384 /NCGR_PEP_ID=MMETSP0190_2-20130828/193083_1 /ASSEMBLY_ACC=CAM_ASM_000263 /TAXON_ID=37353 /ORGANISM="Rosalina sp." /LENGTH=83 /DNA_ID=CAMNT_0048056707 /DNA_START=902 /DNA_END=1153 /DNA_ORIENTATION=+